MRKKGDPSKWTNKIRRIKNRRAKSRWPKRIKDLKDKVQRIKDVIRQMEEQGPKVYEMEPTVIMELLEPPVPESNGQQTNPLIEWTISEYKYPEPAVVDLVSPGSEGPFNDYLTLSLINNF